MPSFERIEILRDLSRDVATRSSECTARSWLRGRLRCPGRLACRHEAVRAAQRLHGIQIVRGTRLSALRRTSKMLPRGRPRCPVPPGCQGVHDHEIVRAV